MIETLNTERLILRPFESTDLGALTDLFSEESFWWYPLRRAMTADESSRFLERVRAGNDAPDPSLHAVIERSSGALAGYAGLSVPNFLPEILPAIEVGWRLGGAFRGKGYATEAAASALQWGFTKIGLSAIVSIAEPENIASLKVMDHLGFDEGIDATDPVLGQQLLVRTLRVESWRAQH